MYRLALREENIVETWGEVHIRMEMSLKKPG